MLFWPFLRDVNRLSSWWTEVSGLRFDVANELNGVCRYCWCKVNTVRPERPLLWCRIKFSHLINKYVSLPNARPVSHVLDNLVLKADAKKKQTRLPVCLWLGVGLWQLVCGICHLWIRPQPLIFKIIACVWVKFHRLLTKPCVYIVFCRMVLSQCWIAMCDDTDGLYLFGPGHRALYSEGGWRISLNYQYIINQLINWLMQRCYILKLAVIWELPCGCSMALAGNNIYCSYSCYGKTITMTQSQTCLLF